MQIKQQQQPKKRKNIFARLSKFGWAAAILVLAFFVLGACTIGGFSAPGSAYYLPAEENVVYYLDFQEDENGETASLAAVYVNVGAVYTGVGDTFTLEFRHANASGSYTNGKFNTAGMGKVTLANIYEEAEAAEGEEAVYSAVGTNYGWVKVFDYADDPVSYSSYRLVRVSASCDLLLGEVAFVDTAGNVIPAYTQEADARAFFDSSYWPSYRDLFRANDRTAVYGSLGAAENLTDGRAPAEGNTAYTQFTQDEKYTLLQIDNIRLGSIVAGGTFNADTDFGPLAALVPMLGTLIFGACPFGLRIMPLLCTAGLIAVLYLFGKELFGRRGYAFLLAALAAAGGLALTVGRLGLAYAPIALCVVAAYWCMFRFFRRGASAAAPAKSACNVLASGLCFALSVALDPKCIFTLIGLVALFAAGYVRQKRRDAAALEAAGAGDGAEGDARGYALDSMQRYARRMLWLFAVLGFIAATVLFTVLAFLPQYFTYMQLYEADPSAPTLGFFTLLFRALGDAFVLDNVTAFTAANAVSPFGWLIGLKGATLFAATGGGTYIAMNVQVNYAMLLTALVGFVGMTAYTVAYAAGGSARRQAAGEHASRAAAAYFVLTAGLITSLLQYAFCGGASAVQSMLFYTFYLGYIPLLFYVLGAQDRSATRRVFGLRLNRTGAVLACACVLYAVFFALSVPMLFSIPLAEAAANGMFGWTTLIGNGYYRV